MEQGLHFGRLDIVWSLGLVSVSGNEAGIPVSSSFDIKV